jgi:hypothetical protein
MQRTTECNSLIKPAAYARLRKLNRSTISRQIREGKIPTHDGLIDPDEADQAREQNLNLRKRRQPAADRIPLPPNFVYGMVYLVKCLRDAGRIESLKTLFIEAEGVTDGQGLAAARAFVFMTSLWIEELLEEELGKDYAQQFDQELAGWIDS